MKGILAVLFGAMTMVFSEAAQPKGAEADDVQFHKTITLQESEKIALEKHPALRIAHLESDLASFKKNEALRSLWPNLTLKGEETEGKAIRELGTPGFNEKSYSAQISQPLFQGGRLFRIYRQTLANLNLAREKYAKVQQETLYSARETFWRLVGASNLIGVYSNALSYLEKEKSDAEQLLKKDVITQQTYLIINSQYQQMASQFESAKAEEESRLWQWTSSLGLKTPPDYHPVPSTASLIVPQISLQECLSLALTHHPDILIQKHTTEAALLGLKALSSYVWPQLDFNASYGQGGGAFKGETLNLREDWQLGLKLSRSFSANSLNFSGFKQKTSPKLGQSSRTEIETVSVSVGVLDGLKQRGERKEADLVYAQSQVQMDKTTLEVQNGVRDAYAGWKKAIAQVLIAQNDLDLARTEFAISEIKVAHQNASFQEKAISRNKLAQAEAALIEAETAYRVAIAALNRALGHPNKFA